MLRAPFEPGDLAFFYLVAEERACFVQCICIAFGAVGPEELEVLRPIVCEMAVDPERDMKTIRNDFAGVSLFAAHAATRLFARV